MHRQKTGQDQQTSAVVRYQLFCSLPSVRNPKTLQADVSHPGFVRWRGLGVIPREY